MKIDLNNICLTCSAFPTLCQGCQEDESCCCQDKRFIEYSVDWNPKIIKFIKEVKKIQGLNCYEWENVVHQIPIPDFIKHPQFITIDSGFHTISPKSLTITAQTAIDKSDDTLQELL